MPIWAMKEDKEIRKAKLLWIKSYRINWTRKKRKESQVQPYQFTLWKKILMLKGKRGERLFHQYLNKKIKTILLDYKLFKPLISRLMKN